MKAIDTIRGALQFSDEMTAKLAEDARDIALTQPTARGGNHPLWVIGHLAFIEGMPQAVILGESNPVGHWAPFFAPGTEPTTDAKVYPSYDEVLTSLRKLRAQNLKLLEQIGDAGLDKAPKNVPAGFEDHMRTIGQVFMLIALHQMGHYGQLADARRAAGRKPLFM